jgi:hypothetical protein
MNDIAKYWKVGSSCAASIGGHFGTGIRASVRVYGKPHVGDPRTIPLKDGTQVAVEVTGPTYGG